MKYFYFLLAFTPLLCSGQLRAQTFVNFTINQPPPLVSSAGTGSTICNGNTVNLAGSASGGYGAYTYQWSPAAGIANPNSAITTASPTATVTYTLTVSDSMNCTHTDDISITVLDCSGIEDAENLQWSVYPNPAKDQFMVEIRSQNSTLAVYSILGSMVYNRNFSSDGNYSIDLTGLPKGAYHVVLESPGYQPSAKTIIIQ